MVCSCELWRVKLAEDYFYGLTTFQMLPMALQAEADVYAAYTLDSP